MINTIFQIFQEAASMLNYNRFSPKRGAADWFVLLRSTNEYVGLINLYELSLETFADNHKKCMIGFQTKVIFQNKGYTKEAVLQLMRYAYDQMNRNKIIASTEKDNIPSKQLLLKIGFTKETEKYIYGDSEDFFEYNFPFSKN
ncbi:MAG: GNAT family N-acetyltransferase [Bacteroidota bacterium]